MTVSPREYLLGVCQDFGICDKSGTTKDNSPYNVYEGSIFNPIADNADLCVSKDTGVDQPKISYWKKSEHPIGHYFKEFFRFFHQKIFRLKKAETTEIQSLYDKTIGQINITNPTSPEYKTFSYLSLTLKKMGANPIPQSSPTSGPALVVILDLKSDQPISEAVNKLTEGLREGNEFLKPLSKRSPQPPPFVAATASVAPPTGSMEAAPAAAAVQEAERTEKPKERSTQISPFQAEAEERNLQARAKFDAWKQGRITTTMIVQDYVPRSQKLTEELTREKLDIPDEGKDIRDFLQMYKVIFDFNPTTGSFPEHEKFYIRFNSEKGDFELSEKTSSLNLAGIKDAIERIKKTARPYLPRLSNAIREEFKKTLKYFSTHYESLKATHPQQTADLQAIEDQISSLIDELSR